MLMSLKLPAKLKAACQNHRLESAMASDAIVEYFSLPMYAPWSAMGQFFQQTYMLFGEPSIPGTPWHHKASVQCRWHLIMNMAIDTILSPQCWIRQFHRTTHFTAFLVTENAAKHTFKAPC